MGALVNISSFSLLKRKETENSPFKKIIEMKTVICIDL